MADPAWGIGGKCPLLIPLMEKLMSIKRTAKLFNQVRSILFIANLNGGKTVTKNFVHTRH